MAAVSSRSGKHVITAKLKKCAWSAEVMLKSVKLVWKVVWWGLCKERRGVGVGFSASLAGVFLSLSLPRPPSSSVLAQSPEVLDCDKWTRGKRVQVHVQPTLIHLVSNVFRLYISSHSLRKKNLWWMFERGPVFTWEPWLGVTRCQISKVGNNWLLRFQELFLFFDQDTLTCKSGDFKRSWSWELQQAKESELMINLCFSRFSSEKGQTFFLLQVS